LPTGKIFQELDEESMAFLYGDGDYIRFSIMADFNDPVISRGKAIAIEKRKNRKAWLWKRL